MLKLTKIFLLFTLLALMSACSDDDAAPDNSINGTWSAKSFDSTISTSVMIGGSDITSSNIITGSNFSYNVTFTNDAFTTSGDYDIRVETTTAGMNIPTANDSYTNVSGAGTYSSDETTLTVNGSFFDFEYNGVSTDALGSEQTVNYVINSDGELVLTQNETMESEVSGTVSTTTIVSTSVWERQ